MRDQKLDVSDIVGTTQYSTEQKEVAVELTKSHNQEFALCGNDLWYFAQFVKTYDEENESKRIFPQFPYLKDCNRQFEENQKNIILKSRRLVITWLGMLRQFWRSKFAGTGVVPGKEVYKGAVMTIGEVEAQELIDRIEFMHEELPTWMKNRNPMVKCNEMYIEFAAGGSVRAFPLKRQGPRSFGFTEAFFDEMAFQEAVRSVYTGMAPTLGAKGKLIAVSTPNGKNNLFHDIWSNKNKKFSEINRIDLDYDLHPEHGEEWLKALTTSMDDRMIAREIHKSFATPAGEPVFPDFDKKTFVYDEEPEFIDGKPVLIGWDLGFHYPACTIWQFNSRDQFVGHLELQGYDIGFEDFCDDVLELMNTMYDRKKNAEIHFGPPDMKNRYRNKSQSGAVNDYDQIKRSFAIGNRRVNVRFIPGEMGTRDNEGPRLKEMRRVFRLRRDGNPGIQLSPRMELLIEGFMGGYCYPENGDTEQPDKNEASHLQDSAQTVVVGHTMQVLPGLVKRNNKETRKRPRLGMRTGL